MVKISNALKIILAAISGFIGGSAVYFIFIWALSTIFWGSEAGGYLFVYGVIGFPFFGTPFAVLVAIITMGYTKARINESLDPAQKKLNTVFLVTLIVIFLAGAALFRLGTSDWIKKTVKDHRVAVN
jgi:hypothetical protein